MALRPEFARYVVTGTLPEGEPHGLDYGHNGERYAHGSRGLRADAADIERCDDVVDARHEHAYDSRHGHRKYDMMNRRGRKKSKIVPIAHFIWFNIHKKGPQPE